MVAFANRGMSNQRLASLIAGLSDDVQGQLGFWQFGYQGRNLVVVTDETHDRMRVMTAVLPEADMGEDDRRAVLAANFDRALDARFAVSHGQLWSVFIHPLRSLTDAQFVDAVNQVKTLADNYGTSYTSSDLVFGPQDD